MGAYTRTRVYTHTQAHIYPVFCPHLWDRSPKTLGISYMMEATKEYFVVFMRWFFFCTTPKAGSWLLPGEPTT